MLIINKIIKRKTLTFREILNPRKESEDLGEILTTGINNKIIGFIMTLVLLTLISKI